jgi:hypothetical protein
VLWFEEKTIMFHKPEEPGVTSIDSLSPTEQVKRDIIQLARDATNHYANSLNSSEEKWAFSVKVRVLALRLQKYTPVKARYWVRDVWKKENEEEEKITNSSLSEDNKKLNILNMKFKFALQVYDMCLLVLHNSPIVETKASGIIDIELPDVTDRIRRTLYGHSDVKLKSIRKKEDVDSEEGRFSIEELTNKNIVELEEEEEEE